MPKTQVYKEPLFVRWNWGFSFTLGCNVFLVPARLRKKRFCALVSSPNSWNVIILNLPVKHIGVLGRMSQNFPQKPGSAFSLSQGGCSLNPHVSGLVRTWPLWRHE